MSKARGLFRDMASLAGRLLAVLVVLGVLSVGGVERSRAEPAVSDVKSSHSKRAPTWVLYGGAGLSAKPDVEETTLTLPGGVPLVMVRIPAGSFEMGRYPGEQDSYADEDPRHAVNIAYDFFLGNYEVTKAQWEAVMETKPWSGQRYVLEDPDSPAVYVSWDNITGSGGFLEKLNHHLEATGQAAGGKPLRLPSEAEWEYACRAGTQTRFYFGDSLAMPDGREDGPAGTLPGNRSDYMWFGANNSPHGSKPVGQKFRTPDLPQGFC